MLKHSKFSRVKYNVIMYILIATVFVTNDCLYRLRSHEPTNQSKWSIYIMRAGGTDSSVRVTVDELCTMDIQ